MYRLLIFMSFASVLAACGGRSDRLSRVDQSSVEALSGNWVGTECVSFADGTSESHFLTFGFEVPVSWDDPYFSGSELEWSGGIEAVKKVYNNSGCIGSPIAVESFLPEAQQDYYDISVLQSTVTQDSFQFILPTSSRIDMVEGIPRTVGEGLRYEVVLNETGSAVSFKLLTQVSFLGDQIIDDYVYDEVDRFYVNLPIDPVL